MDSNSRILAAACWLLAAVSAGAAPPIIEVSDARPLFVFRAPPQGTLEPLAYDELLVGAWSQLPESIRNRGAYGFDISPEWVDLVEVGFIFRALHADGIAVSATVADSNRALGVETIGNLFAANPNLVAIHARNIPIPDVRSFGNVMPTQPAPEVQWLARVLDLCAAHGRFLSIEWSTRDLIALLAEPTAESLYRTLKYYAPYTVLTHSMEYPTVLTSTAALTGLWMEGVVDQWGVALSPRWYSQTDFVSPGTWGQRDAASHMPPGMYRAMTLSAAAAGATVFRFEDSADLWFGERGYQWAESIAPTLIQLMDLGAIPRRDVAIRSVQIAYQCGTAEHPAECDKILEELNPAYGNGGLERNVYAVESPIASPDLLPNRADHYLVPLISPRAGIDLTQQFENIVLPGLAYTDDEWQRLLGSLSEPAAEGTATILNVGRAVYVLHNRENAYERQNYRIPDMPAPVRGVKVRRTDAGIELEWPFRENDFAYTVYRRTLPELTFEPIARNLDVRTYIDSSAPAGETVGYALTALTNEPETIEGAVNWGEYRVYSAAVSRIEEEVIVLPETEIAISAPVAVVSRNYPEEQPLWPAINGLSTEDTETAFEVAARLKSLQDAVVAEDVGRAASLFAREYQGADGSNAAFAIRAFESFFVRYDGCRLFLQPQDWFVENVTEPRVSVTVYAGLSGVDASTDLRRPINVSRIAKLKFGQRDGDWRIISAESPFPALIDATL